MDGVQRCQHKIKQRRCMQHVNKHALGGIPQTRHAGPFHLPLTAICYCCCSTRAAAKCKMTRTQLSSLTIDALTFASPPGPHPAEPAPCPQKLTQGPRMLRCARLPYSLAASCFREGRLVQQQQGPVSIRQQMRTRWFPRAGRT